MPRYEVDVTFSGTFEVEADNEKQACEQAESDAADDLNAMSADSSAELIDDDDEIEDEDERE